MVVVVARLHPNRSRVGHHSSSLSTRSASSRLDSSDYGRMMMSGNTQADDQLLAFNYTICSPHKSCPLPHPSSFIRPLSNIIFHSLPVQLSALPHSTDFKFRLISAPSASRLHHLHESDINFHRRLFSTFFPELTCITKIIFNHF
jgi:hypothetical protein